MQQFNDAQQAAIDATNRAILASAGAGAGKTSVMTERIVRQILAGKKVEQMLVVTFTNEAAAGMKEKIRQRLNEVLLDDQSSDREKRAAAQAIMSMPSCHISTLHSFCRYVLQNGYMLVGIDSQFGIADSAVADLRFSEAVESAVKTISDEAYPADKKKAFGRLCRTVLTADLPGLCSDLFGTLMGIPDPWNRLHAAIESITLPPERNPWAESLLNYEIIRLKALTGQIPLLVQAEEDPRCPEKGLNAVRNDRILLEQIRAALDQPTEELVRVLQEVQAAAQNVPGLRNLSPDNQVVWGRYKEIHAQIKGKDSLLTEITANLAYLTDPEQIQINRRIRNQLRGLEVLMREVDCCYTAAKREKNELDFSDLEQYAWLILTDESRHEVRDSIRHSFTDIYVDECQDISGIQYAIINALKGPETHTFFVGDIKQSIYRFRHADPLLFLSLRDTWREDPDAPERKIFFRHNYRSAPAIIDCVNAVFASAMSRELTEIDYEPGDHLIAGRTDLKSAPTQVVLVDEDSLKYTQTDKLDAQCSEVAEKIRELLSDGFRYRDIVILLRSAKDRATRITDALTKAHIPAYYAGKQTYFDVPEVARFVELLKCIDNRQQDIPLTTVLSQMPFSMTETELAEIRCSRPDRSVPFHECFRFCAERNETALDRECRRISDLLDSWQRMSRIKRASDLIWMLLKDEGIYALQSAMPGGDMRTRNLYALHQRAVSQEKLGKYRLSEFLDYVRDLTRIKGNSSESAAPLGENDNFVRVMTIHASKGLEFPAVIVMDMQRKIHGGGRSETVLSDFSGGQERPALGIYMPCIDRKHHMKQHSWGKNAFHARTYLNELAEETRMLYVAMTRARQRLILVGTFRGSDVSRWMQPDRKARILSTVSMFDMVMPVVLAQGKLPETGICRSFPAETADGTVPLWTVFRSAGRTIEDTEEMTEDRPWPEFIFSGKDVTAEWQDPAARIDLPAKTSVTAVISGSSYGLDEDDDTQDDKEDPALPPFHLPEEPEMPEFMRPTATEKAADLGTAVHRYMHLLNYARVTEAEATLPALAEELAQMTQAGIFTEAEAETVIPLLKGIAAFLTTEQGQEASEPEVRREQDLTVVIESHGQEVLVQGIVDVLYLNRNGHWVILDYKTDKDTRPERLIERHTDQLNWYRLAVEKITGIPVDELWIAALRNGQVCRIPPKNQVL